MKFLIPTVISILVLCFFTCGDSGTDKVQQPAEIDPFEAAVPHGASLPSTELSAADKEKLSQAKGRIIKIIEHQTLVDKVANAKGILTIFNFWSFENPTSLVLNEHLTKIQNEFGHNKVKLVYINIDQLATTERLNTYIREKGIVDEVYYINDLKDKKNWSFDIFQQWNGDLPALIVVNRSDGTNLLYQKAFNYEELAVVIQPLTL